MDIRGVLVGGPVGSPDTASSEATGAIIARPPVQAVAPTETWLACCEPNAEWQAYPLMRRRTLAADFATLAADPTPTAIRRFANRFGWLVGGQIVVPHVGVPVAAEPESLWQRELEAYAPLRNLWNAVDVLLRARSLPPKQIARAEQWLATNRFRRTDGPAGAWTYKPHQWSPGAHLRQILQTRTGLKGMRTPEQAAQILASLSEELAAIMETLKQPPFNASAPDVGPWPRPAPRAPRGTDGPPADELLRRARDYLYHTLNARLRGHVHAEISAKGDTLRYHPDSLLTAIYLHFAFDVIGRALPERACDACGQTFTPGRADARFCSKNCRERAGYHKRKTRSAEKRY
jgi:hypothetical protein